MVDWKIFIYTFAKFYAIGYGIIFALTILGIFLGLKLADKFRVSVLDILFFIWAFATAVYKATT